MEITGLVVFASALLVAAASPGPAVAALVARVIGRGTQGAIPFVMGIAIGDVAWLGIAVLGLAFVAQAFHEVFLVIKYAGAAYLLYLGYRLWTAPVEAREIAADRRREGGVRLFLAGFALTMGNPKVVAFYLALLPNLIDLTRVGLLGYLELAGIALVILGFVLGAYVLAAAQARSLFRSARAQRLLNRTSGGLMAGAAAAVAAK